MKIAHGLAIGSLAFFAFACDQGEPADPTSTPRTSSPASASADGPTQGQAGKPGNGGGATTRRPDDAPGQSDDGSPASSPSPSPAPSQPLPLTEQGAVGQKLFQTHCTGCHGGSVRLASFDTAADVIAYVSINMPRNAPGSLTQSEYFSIVAFDLTENGIDLQGQTLDAANAGAVSAH